jgi:hypothetical protein
VTFAVFMFLTVAVVGHFDEPMFTVTSKSVDAVGMCNGETRYVSSIIGQSGRDGLFGSCPEFGWATQRVVYLRSDLGFVWACSVDVALWSQLDMGTTIKRPTIFTFCRNQQGESVDLNHLSPS